MIRIKHLIKINVATFFRRPFNLALVIIGVPTVIYGFMVFMRALPDRFFPGISAEVGAATGGLFAVACLVGVVGLFQMISSLEADKRLSISGFLGRNILVARFFGIFIISLIISGVSLGIMSYWVIPKSFVRVFLILTLTGFLYGLIGILIGSVITRELEGSLVLIFLADIDIFLSMEILEFDSSVVNYFPLRSPTFLLRLSVFEGYIDISHMIVLLVYILVFLYFSIIIFDRTSFHKEGLF